jgi:hypothetical protein
VCPRSSRYLHSPTSFLQWLLINTCLQQRHQRGNLALRPRKILSICTSYKHHEPLLLDSIEGCIAALNRERDSLRILEGISEAPGLLGTGHISTGFPNRLNSTWAKAKLLQAFRGESLSNPGLLCQYSIRLGSGFCLARHWRARRYSSCFAY